MKNKSRAFVFWLIPLLFLIIFISLTVHSKSVKVHCDSCGNLDQINSNLQLDFQFSRNINPALIERAWFTQPQIEGTWEWKNDRQAHWQADQPLISGSSFSFGFKPEVVGKKSEKILSEYRWIASVRVPRILALKTIKDSGQEIFLREISDESIWEQFTFTGGNVHDFFPSPDGEQIIYSVKNGKGGFDLWIIGRDGANLHRLQDCGDDLCSDAVWSPDAQEIAFVQGNSQVQSDTAAIDGIIWLLDMENNLSRPLSENTQTTQHNPAWSPDGEWLSYWSDQRKEITLLNRSSGEQIVLEASKGDTDCWSSDSRLFYFPILEFQQAAFHQVIRQADLENNTLQTVIGGDDERDWLNYDNFACHPLEPLIAVTVQTNVKLPGKQLWLVDLQTTERVMISDDLAHIPSNLRWSSTGDHLLFQMNLLAAEEHERTIWVWDRSTGQLELMGDQLHSPEWLP